jgi:hypothetical protein
LRVSAAPLVEPAAITAWRTLIWRRSIAHRSKFITVGYEGTADMFVNL